MPTGKPSEHTDEAAGAVVGRARGGRSRADTWWSGGGQADAGSTSPSVVRASTVK
ncbi:hypothetical protein Dimus_032323, partial [Dionaea muscipula]